MTQRFNIGWQLSQNAIIVCSESCAIRGELR